MPMLKHVGKMKHNDAKVCVVYRTIPGDANSALVVGTATLVDTYHNSLMQLVESVEAQQANELGDAMSTRYFPDGTNMLEQLHMTGKLVKVPTNKVLMTPTTSDHISLDELNVMIAEQKGVSLNDLAIKAETKVTTQAKTKIEDVEVKDLAKMDAEREVESVSSLTEGMLTENLSARDLRSRADKLYKEAALLRKKADELDPPKKKSTSVAKNTETT
jgi:hypothetical protein